MNLNWGGWLFIGFILLLLWFLSMMLKDPVRLCIKGKRTVGIVVAMTKVEDSQHDTLRVPVVEFVTSTGERARARSRQLIGWSLSRLGDKVTVLYNPSNPSDAHLVMLNEYRGVVFVLGFIAFVIFLWTAVIVSSGVSTFDDPFHLLPKLIAHFHLSSVRFPILFILSFAIPACGIGTYWTYQSATNLRANGIKTIGHVIGSEWNSSTLSDGSKATGLFPMITFEDASGASHTIRRSLAKPLSRLQAGEEVEVIYPTGQPDLGVVNTWDEFWPPTLFFGLMFIAFIILFRLTLIESLDASKSWPNSQKKLMTTGVPAIAIVLSANPKTRLLKFRIDKDPQTPSTKLDEFISLENAISDWKPPQTNVEIQKGDQFRAYLDPLKPFDYYYIDFSHRLGSDRFVKSIEEEDAEDDENDKVMVSKLTNLITICSPYLSPENASEIQTLITDNDLCPAYEKLITRLMNLPKPLPAPLQKVDWNDFTGIGVYMGFDEDSEDDPEFWKKFQTFTKELN
ncbi:MAG: DUF3592 domain-containing protein [Bacteroidia bacterium]|nr:DUF3592 domain-containing protein [Bacteroidia bacterium]